MDGSRAMLTLRMGCRKRFRRKRSAIEKDMSYYWFEGFETNLDQFTVPLLKYGNSHKVQSHRECLNAHATMNGDYRRWIIDEA